MKSSNIGGAKLGKAFRGLAMSVDFRLLEPDLLFGVRRELGARVFFRGLRNGLAGGPADSKFFRRATAGLTMPCSVPTEESVFINGALRLLLRGLPMLPERLLATLPVMVLSSSLSTGPSISEKRLFFLFCFAEAFRSMSRDDDRAETDSSTSWGLGMASSTSSIASQIGDSKNDDK